MTALASRLMLDQHNPDGVSLVPTDDFTLTLNAAGNDFFKVTDTYANEFVPFSFLTSPNDTRTGNAVSTFFNNGSSVFSITENAVSQS